MADASPEPTLSEDFSRFEIGMFSADVGPLTEYHYLPEAAPRHGWAVAAFGSRGAGTAWKVIEESGRHVMCQTYTNAETHTHPMISAGNDLWDDYDVSVQLKSDGGGRCGLVLRYHNNRCYYFFGFDHERLVLLKVRHEREFHVPDETVLGEIPAHREDGRLYEARARVEGAAIRAEIAGIGTIEARDTAYPGGKIGLLSDGPARFYEVRVRMSPASAKRVSGAAARRSDELSELRKRFPAPRVTAKIRTEGFGTGRNLRFGDLDGDGRIDIAIGQMHAHGPRDAYSESGCITAVDLDGTVLWQNGAPNPREYVLTNDVAFQIHDIDGDGANEVIFTRNFEIIVLDGKTGKVRAKAPTPKSLPPADKFERILGDSLFFADFRGIGRPGDVLIKDRYWHFWVYDENLKPLWDGSCKTGHYPNAMDVDGDGRDELAIGFSFFDHDGRRLWSLDETINDHADGVAIVSLGGDTDERPRIFYTASDEGMMIVDLDGNVQVHHRIGHAQNPAIAKLRSDLSGLQAVSVNFWGNQGILHFYDQHGAIYHDTEPINMGSMCLPINWTGNGEELFVHSANPVYGGMFDGWGRPVVMFPNDGHPDMCNAVLDTGGDCRDEVVVWDQNEIWVYTQEDDRRGQRLYRPRRNPLYNYSNYQATISLPGWYVP